MAKLERLYVGNNGIMYGGIVGILGCRLDRLTTLTLSIGWDIY